MARYQVRTPEGMILEDVIDELATGAWNVLRAWRAFDLDSLTGAAYDQFRQGIRSTLTPSVKTFKLCGLSNICLDEAKSTPWSFQSHVLEASPTDLVYHLYTGANPQEFLAKLAQGAFDSIERHIKPDLRMETLSTLQAVFREVLGRYLYDNAVCGKTELCALSSSAPIPVWNRGRR